MSNCTLYDSLYLDSVLTADLATLYIEDNVDSLDTFTTYPINFYVFSECDTLQPLNPTQQKLNNPEHPMKQTQVYPNPMDQYFVVELADVSNSLVSVSDQLGKSMYSVTTNQSQVRIDSSNWPAGIYFVQISSGNRTEAIKMVKM